MSTTSPHRRVLVVEPDWLTATKIRRALDPYFDVEAVAGRTDGERALSRRRPDLVIIGFEDCTEALTIAKGIAQPLLFVTTEKHESMLRDALRLGPRAIVLKPFSDSQLRASAELALQRDDHPLTAARETLAKIADLLAEEPSLRTAVAPEVMAPLSRREREILRSLLAHHGVPSIATRLGISRYTVRNHLKSAMAGGDGSQAIVARIAAERGVPYACIPAGTRNHFARDLGVDRDDVIGALDAFVDGGERRVDLAEVNGRTFVNNVSLGVYGQAVQRAGYRNAKIRTILETAPDVIGLETHPDLRWRSPDGEAHEGAAAIVISNNPYRLGHGLGDGTRPRLDDGTLGVAVVWLSRDEPAARTWTTPSCEIDARGPVHAGIDGEAAVLEPPLRLRTRPAALRCRIARRHPGGSPSAFAPEGPWDAIRKLTRIALGRNA